MFNTINDNDVICIFNYFIHLTLIYFKNKYHINDIFIYYIENNSVNKCWGWGWGWG